MRSGDYQPTHDADLPVKVTKVESIGVKAEGGQYSSTAGFPMATPPSTEISDHGDSGFIQSAMPVQLQEVSPSNIDDDVLTSQLLELYRAEQMVKSQKTSEYGVVIKSEKGFDKINYRQSLTAKKVRDNSGNVVSNLFSADIPSIVHTSFQKHKTNSKVQPTSSLLRSKRRFSATINEFNCHICGVKTKNAKSLKQHFNRL